MGAKDKDREKEYSPNPDLKRPKRRDPEAERAACYAYHKAAGTLGDYYAAYPGDCPWDYGLTPEERAAAYGELNGGPERERHGRRGGRGGR